MLAWAKHSFLIHLEISSSSPVSCWPYRFRVIIYLHLTHMEIINWCPESQTLKAIGVLCYSWRPWLQSGLSIHWPGVPLYESCVPCLCMNQLKGRFCCQWNWLYSLWWGFKVSHFGNWNKAVRFGFRWEVTLLMFLHGTWVSLGRQNMLRAWEFSHSKLGKQKQLTLQYCIWKLWYYEQSLLYCVRACDFASNQIAGIFLSVFWCIIIGGILWVES